jgi:hypothetical protein
MECFSQTVVASNIVGTDSGYRLAQCSVLSGLTTPLFETMFGLEGGIWWFALRRDKRALDCRYLSRVSMDVSWRCTQVEPLVI